ncbi:hypothetical protein GBAR_LOCUS9426 [Geodia barretti]|uniref:Uncharacterized protein n=1 Tax=Geodia barretti TaxID=519541 RepID=A0AA35RP32_GEOBA|nr:hypothetical protein GBAR_LOCUS9426 [Geodia barretti]
MLVNQVAQLFHPSACWCEAVHPVRHIERVQDAVKYKSAEFLDGTDVRTLLAPDFLTHAVVAERTLQYDIKREKAHSWEHRKRFATACLFCPLVDQRLHAFVVDQNVRFQDAEVETRRKESPVSSPLISLGKQEPIAEPGSKDPVNHLRFRCLEYLPRGLGMVDVDDQFERSKPRPSHLVTLGRDVVAKLKDEFLMWEVLG